MFGVDLVRSVRSPGSVLDAAMEFRERRLKSARPTVSRKSRRAELEPASGGYRDDRELPRKTYGPALNDPDSSDRSRSWRFCMPAAVRVNA